MNVPISPLKNNDRLEVLFDVNSEKSQQLLEMIHFTGDIYENHVPQHLLPF